MRERREEERRKKKLERTTVEETDDERKRRLLFVALARCKGFEGLLSSLLRSRIRTSLQKGHAQDKGEEEEEEGERGEGPAAECEKQIHWNVRKKAASAGRQARMLAKSSSSPARGWRRRRAGRARRPAWSPFRRSW